MRRLCQVQAGYLNVNLSSFCSSSLLGLSQQVLLLSRFHIYVIDTHTVQHHAIKVQVVEPRLMEQAMGTMNDIARIQRQRWQNLCMYWRGKEMRKNMSTRIVVVHRHKRERERW